VKQNINETGQSVLTTASIKKTFIRHTHTHRHTHTQTQTQTQTT